MENIPFLISHASSLMSQHIPNAIDCKYNVGMWVLVLNLDSETSERVDYGKLSGFSLSMRLLSDYEGETPIVITSPSQEALLYPGSAVFTMLFHSPLTGKLEYEYSAMAPGYSMYRLGYSAIVITGRMRRLGMVYLNAEGAEFVNAESMSGFPSEKFESAARRNVTDVFLSIGRAGENGVLFASVQSAGHEAAASGMGFVFGEKNLKGICFPGFQRKDDINNGKVQKRFMKKLEKSRIVKRMKKEGSCIFIDSALRMGFLPVRNYRERFNPRAYNLDGKAMSDAYGVFPDSCQDCPLLCGRRKSTGSMLPSWKECVAFGSNIGLFSLESVSRVADAVRREGLGVEDTGALLAYLTDGEADADKCLHLITQMANERISNVYREGAASFPDAIIGPHSTPMITDPRGDTSGALLYSLGLRAESSPSLLFPPSPLFPRSGAIMALYEAIYRYALVSEGYSPLVALVSWWGYFPSFLYRFPLILRIASLLFRAYGMSNAELLCKGFDIFSTLISEPSRLPDRFSSDPESAYRDGRTVEYTKLIDSYECEKAIVRRIVKSRRDRIERQSGKNRTHVGPDDERGREGDPGLEK